MDNKTPDGPEAYDQFDDEDDFQLIEWICEFKDSDPDTAQAAWGCLYRRHFQYLLNVTSKRALDMLGNDAAAEDVVNNIFVDLYEKKAATFKAPDEPLDKIAKRRWLRAWLGKIAQREILDLGRARKGHPTCQLEQDHWSDLEGKQDDVFATADTKRVRKVMDHVLDDREQDIVRTTYQYYDPSTGAAPKLKPEDLQRLCDTHGIMQENLRQIRKRALAKVKAALQTAPVTD